MPIGTVPGAAAGDQLGFAVAALDDVSNDGVREILMGQPGAGSVLVFNGRSLAGTPVLLNTIGAPAGSASFGADVDGIGDASGDGLSDLIVGAPGIGTSGQSGIVFVMDGAVASQFIYSWSGPANSTIPWGDVVANVGDLNGDQVDDMAFRSSVDLGAGSWGYAVHVIDGSTGQTMYTGPLQAPAGVNQFGLAIVGTPDMDGDGLPDLAIGGSRLTLFSGLTGLEIGNSGSQRADAITVMDDVSPVPDGVADLALGQPGVGSGRGQLVVLDGASLSSVPVVLFQASGLGALDGFGFAVTTVGDVDGDGLDEVLVGAPQTGMAPGYAELVSGRDGCRLGRFTGAAGSGSRFGFDVSVFDDLDGDFRGDLIIGAPAILGSAGEFWVYSHMWVGPSIGSEFCLCPSGAVTMCGNISTSGGCTNSATFGTSGLGGLLKAYGTTSLAADDLFFEVTNLPPGVTCLPFYGGTSSQTSVLFYDGILCIDGPITRLNPSLQASATGSVIIGPCITGGLTGVTAGNSLSFQVWYRDPLGPCSNGSNVTSGITLTFTP